MASTDAGRPAAGVFTSATDPARFSQWQKGVTDGHMDATAGHGGFPALGSRCVTTRRIGGASRTSTSELMHIDRAQDLGGSGHRRPDPGGC